MEVVELGSGGIDDLLAVREPIPVIKGTKDYARLLARVKNTPVAFIDSEQSVDCLPTMERMDELRKAAEPLRDYLLKYGNPHTCVIVTQYAASVKQDEIGISFVKSDCDERSAAFEQELRELMTNVCTKKPGEDKNGDTSA